MNRSYSWTILCLLLLTSLCSAHWKDDSSLKMTVEGTVWEVEWRVPRALVGEADENGDGVLDEREIRRHRKDLGKTFEPGFRLISGDTVATQTILPGREKGNDAHVSLSLRFSWEHPVDYFDLQFGAFPKDLVGSQPPRCLAAIDFPWGQSAFVLAPSQASMRFDLVPPSPREKDPPKPARSSWDTLRDFTALGLSHIAAGWDHLLFVLCLLLAVRSLGQLLVVVTSFTVAHSLSLAAAVLGYVTLPGRVVEPLIALSISVAAFEAWRQVEARKVVLLAGAFGLVHGLGFASVLVDLLTLEGKNIALPLLGFNLGVELGQLIAVILAYPFVRLLRTKDPELRGIKAISVVLMIAGLLLAVTRLIAPGP